MSVDAIKCPKCRQPLPDKFMNAGIRNCTFCGKSVGLRVFPALFRKAEQETPSQIQPDEGESSCFYHENLHATVHCEGCGRFLCPRATAGSARSPARSTRDSPRSVVGRRSRFWETEFLRPPSWHSKSRSNSTMSNCLSKPPRRLPLPSKFSLPRRRGPR